MIDKIAQTLNPPLRLIPKSERAIKQHNEFFERYQTIRRRNVWKNCLNILVHGPGPGAEKHRDVHNKRIQIVNILRGDPLNQNADICEELVSGADWREQELALAMVSDLVLIVTGSSAPAAELGDLINHDDVRPKLMAFIDRSEQHAYLGRTAVEKLGPPRVLFFDYPGDLDSCELATRAVQTVEDHLLGSLIKQVHA